MKAIKIIIIFLTIIFIGLVLMIVNEQRIKYNDKKIQKEIYDKTQEIKSHYSEYVITTKETFLYKKDGESYIEVGKINSNVKINLKNDAIDIDTKYFHISDLDLYINYEDVKPTEEYIKNNRYTNYVPFNKSIKTKEVTTFYDENNNYIYLLKNTFDFPVLIMDEEKYGVAFNDELFYVKSEDVESLYDSENTNLKNKSRIKTLTYHAIYNPTTSECDTSICQTLDMFESHLKYISENDYFTLKLNELELYLDGKLQVPEKSIVITIDDGTLLDSEALALLEKYKVNATLFAVTSWVDVNSFKSEYLDLESHTHNMHNQYECPGYGMQGGGILCLPEEQVISDLKISQEMLGGSKYFAYPFFDFNDRAISLLKQAGFKLAFIGQYDTDGYSYPLITDRYKVRRKTIFSDTSMNEFISYLQ